MAWKQVVDERATPRSYFTWQLDRPAPALPYSYFWTWDHSTNWVLDDPGMQAAGCFNRYFKRPETFVEDYRRLTDLAAGLGVRGIVIWGFLRDAHLGPDGAKAVAGYARSRGVEVYPGLGVTAYGGVYYEGDHPYSLPTFLRRCPEARLIGPDGAPHAEEGCIAHGAFREWFAEATAWLFREFDIAGCNLENGDLIIDHHPLMKDLRARNAWPAGDPEALFHQAMSYKLALDSIGRDLKDVFASYATYCGFNLGEKLVQNGPMGPRPPAMFSVLPPQAVAQWTLTGMLRPQPLPLTAYLDDGAPAAAFDNPNWPAGLRPPNRRSVGFVHQGSQWWRGWCGSRYDCVVSQIKEACLRAHRAGLEGVSIHGELTSRHLPYALNYLAFSHFIHWPEDSMRDFGRKTMAQVLGSAKDGEDFVEALCHAQAGTATEEHRKMSDPAGHGFTGAHWTSRCDTLEQWQRCQFWLYLHALVRRQLEKWPAEDIPAPFVY